jgi:hypothetical protein
MLNIGEYNPFFIKKSFNLPEYKQKRKKRIIVDYDPLFIVLFNKINNYDDTTMYQLNEKQEKIKIAVEIEKLKIKPKDKEEIIQNLMYENKITLKTLNAICMLYKINLLYVKDNIFIRMCYNETVPLCLSTTFIEFNEDIYKKYEVDLDKPLRCASYYKIDDLRQISLQLHLPIENIKKQQLYDSIHNVLINLLF